MKNVLFTLMILGLSATIAVAQINTPAPSPSSELKQTVGLTDITLNYSRPGKKDRTIFAADGLCPYGQIWRTGANAATTIEFSKDVNFGGHDVEAGKYALYTVPNADSWDVMLYSDLSLGGNVAGYDTENEVMRASVKPDQMPFSLETLTLDIGSISDESAEFGIIWDNVYVGVPIKVHTGDQVMAQIDQFAQNPMGQVAGNYLNGGWYLYTSGADKAKANEFMKKGLEYTNTPFKFFWMNRAAEVQAANGDYKGAVMTAKAAHEAGMNAPENAKGFYEGTVKAQLDANIKKWSTKS